MSIYFDKTREEKENIFSKEDQKLMDQASMYSDCCLIEKPIQKSRMWKKLSKSIDRLQYLFENYGFLPYLWVTEYINEKELAVCIKNDLYPSKTRVDYIYNKKHKIKQYDMQYKVILPDEYKEKYIKYLLTEYSDMMMFTALLRNENFETCKYIIHNYPDTISPMAISSQINICYYEGRQKLSDMEKLVEWISTTPEWDGETLKFLTNEDLNYDKEVCYYTHRKKKKLKRGQIWIDSYELFSEFTKEKWYDLIDSIDSLSPKGNGFSNRKVYSEESEESEEYC